MYLRYRKDYYKQYFCTGIEMCILFGIASYYCIAVLRNDLLAFIPIMVIIVSITAALYNLIKYLKYLRKDIDFVVLRIDDNGMLLCRKKNEEVFIKWEKIKHVIFVIDRYASKSKVIVRQHNKETHELLLNDAYFHTIRPRGAIKAAYKYTDDRDKIMEVKTNLGTTYGVIMYELHEKERKKRERERKRERKKEKKD